MFSKQGVYIFYVVVGSVLGACTAPETVSHIENKYDRARQLDDYSTAIVYLHELLDLDSDNNTIYKRLGDCYFKIGKYESAIQAIDIALKEANEIEQQQLLSIKAKALVALANYLDAIAVYKTLVNIDKKNELAHLYEIGVLYQAYGDIGNAVLEMRKLVKHPLAKLVQKEIVLETTTELVSYYHAGLNYIGSLQIKANDYGTALKTYELLFQEPIVFNLAKQNYKALLELIKQKNLQLN